MFETSGGGAPFEGDMLDAAMVAGWVPPDPEDPWSDHWGEPVGELPDRSERRWPAAAGPALGELSVGPRLAAALAAADLAGMAAADLVEVVAGWERLMSWARAAQAEALLALTRCAEMRPEPGVAGGGGFRSLSSATITAAEVAAALTLTTRQAENLVGEAVQLVEDFPLTHAALGSGRLDARRAKVIADELGGQESVVRRAVEAALIAPSADPGSAEASAAAVDPEAPDVDLVAAGRDVSGMDSTVLRRQLKAAVHRLVPVTSAQRNMRARAARFVRITPARDGMAWLEALLPAEDAMAVKRAVDAAAVTLRQRDRAAGAAETRSADQRRADALAALAWASLGAGRLGGHSATPGTQHTVSLAPDRGRPVTVEVSVSLATLVGLDEAPAEMAGYGPIPAQVARELSAAGVWRWLRRDPGSGALLDLGRTRYLPTRALAEFVAVRDRECVMPGCHRPARACQLDHTVPFPHGPTAASNLGSLCQAHHVMKHRSRWRVDQPEPGAFRWISPTGRVHLVRPDDQSRVRTRARTIEFDALVGNEALSGDQVGCDSGRGDVPGSDPPGAGGSIGGIPAREAEDRIDDERERQGLDAEPPF